MDVLTILWTVLRRMPTAKIKQLLEVVGLSDRMNAKSSDLSTGFAKK